MTPEQFAYWLHGFFEISDSSTLKLKQVEIIKDHLNLVFNKVTPNRNVDLGTYCSPIPPELYSGDSMNSYKYLGYGKTIKWSPPKDYTSPPEGLVTC